MDKIRKIINYDDFVNLLVKYYAKTYRYINDVNDNLAKNVIEIKKNDKEYFIKLENNNYKLIKIKKNEAIKINNISTLLQTINSFCIIKIKDYKLSSTIFGYSKTKKEMFESNKSFFINDFHQDFKCKKDNIIRNIVEISNGIKNLKFVLEDIEIQYPNFDKIFKGFNESKDKTIKKYSNVMFKLKHIDQKTYKVLSVEYVGNKVFCHLINNGVKKIKNIKELKLI